MFGCFLDFYADAVLPRPQIVTPAGIGSVNGSSVDMGCSGNQNCLFDGQVPHINTSLFNWATELVTIRASEPNYNIPFYHIVLTFFFERSVKLSSIEFHLFLCSEWGIDAPYIGLYGDNSGLYGDNSTEFIHTGSGDFIINYDPLSGTCGCLSTISIPVQWGEPSYPVWHILISFLDLPSPQWTHLGEVVFMDALNRVEAEPYTTTNCAFEPPPGQHCLTPHI